MSDVETLSSLVLRDLYTHAGCDFLTATTRILYVEGAVGAEKFPQIAGTAEADTSSLRRRRRTITTNLRELGEHMRGYVLPIKILVAAHAALHRVELPATLVGEDEAEVSRMLRLTTIALEADPSGLSALRLMAMQQLGGDVGERRNGAIAACRAYSQIALVVAVLAVTPTPHGVPSIQQAKDTEDFFTRGFTTILRPPTTSASTTLLDHLREAADSPEDSHLEAALQRLATEERPSDSVDLRVVMCLRLGDLLAASPTSRPEALSWYQQGVAEGASLRLRQLSCQRAATVEPQAKAVHKWLDSALGFNDEAIRQAPFWDQRVLALDERAELTDQALSQYTRAVTTEATESANGVHSWGIAEVNKSRQLRATIALARIAAPRGVSSALLERERVLIEELHTRERASEAGSLLQRDGNSSTGTSDKQRSLRFAIEGIWAEMLRLAPHAAPYVDMRRDDVRDGASLLSDARRVADEIGVDVSFCSFFVTRFNHVLVWHVGPPYREVTCHVPDLDLVDLRAWISESLTPAPGREDDDWRQLGDELFGPIANQLTTADLVVLLPHKWLHDVPLHAFNIDGRSLVEWTPVVYSPSLGVFRFVRPAGTLTGKFVGRYFAPDDPEAHRTDAAGNDERLAATMGSDRLSANVDHRCLHDALHQNHIVNVTCHGQFSSDKPLSSGLKLSDGTFTARDFLALDVNVDLLSLPACEVGLNSVRGDEADGLMRCILASGVRSCLITLCEVSRLKTPEWILAFYESLQADRSITLIDKARAFQQATVKIAATHPHAYFWSPFKLVSTA